jgi:hypothetical protein
VEMEGLERDLTSALERLEELVINEQIDAFGRLQVELVEKFQKEKDEVQQGAEKRILMLQGEWQQAQMNGQIERGDRLEIMLQEAEQYSTLELCKIDDEITKAEKALESRLKRLLEDIEEARKSKDSDAELLIRGESRSTGGGASRTLIEQNQYAMALSQIHWVTPQGRQDSDEAALQQVDSKWIDIERLKTWLSICDTVRRPRVTQNRPIQD